MKISMFMAAALAVLISISASAQTGQKPAREQYAERYNLLVNKLGTAGVGIETLLDRWQTDYPDDPDMMAYRFLYYFTKSQSTQAVAKTQDKFLGQKPIIELKDSSGNPVKYFQETFYDDDLFGKAVKEIDKAIDKYPDRLDFRVDKISAYVAYEKESPDIATMTIISLIDYNGTQKPEWIYPDMEKVDADFFDAMIQEYCVSFFRNASARSYNAFMSISERMLNYEPENVLFLDNMGSYFLVAENDSKAALKYYNKVLKIKKDDLTAIQNCILLARKDKNAKLEKKYLEMMVKYGETDQQKQAASLRLKQLS